MNLPLLVFCLFTGGLSLALWIKFKAANHTAKSLLERLKNTSTELEETKRQLASANLTLDAMRVERTQSVYESSQNGSANKGDSKNSSDPKRRRYNKKPKNQ